MATGEKGLLADLSLGERLFYLRCRSKGMGRGAAVSRLYEMFPQAARYTDDQQFKRYEQSKQARDEAQGHLAHSFANKGWRLLSLCEMATYYLDLFYKTDTNDTNRLHKMGEQARYCFNDIAKLADGLPQEQVQAPLEMLYEALKLAISRPGGEMLQNMDWSFPGRSAPDHSRPEGVAKKKAAN